MTNFLHRFNRAVWRNIFHTIRFIVRHTPYAVFRILYVFFVAAGYIFTFLKWPFVLANLRTAFAGEKTEQEIKSIAWQYFRTMNRGMIDLIYFLDRPEEVRRQTRIEGKEHLESALAQGKGAVVISAHFGVFIMMYLRLALEGYKVNVVMRRMRDEVFEEQVEKYRHENGIHTIYAQPERQCIVEALRCLRRGELLVMLMDQSFGREGGVFVDFLGKKAATAPGSVIFAKRADAPIVPMFIMSDEKGGHKIVIEPAIEQVRLDDEQKETGANVYRCSQVIERYVRQYPHQWGGWMHRRWKKEYNPERDFYYKESK